MKKLSLFLSVFFTIFVLGIAFGVVKAVQAFNLVQVNQQAAQLTQTQSVAMAGQVQALATSTPFAPTYTVTADQASQIGLASAGSGETLASQPELVLYDGTPAYEVKLSDGTTLYVDAQTGTLLFNSLTGNNQPVISDLDAIQAASVYMNSTQVVAFARSVYSTQPVFDVSFQNGSHVFVSMTGSIVAANIVKVVSNPFTVTNPPTSSTHPPAQAGEIEDDGHE